MPFLRLPERATVFAERADAPAPAARPAHPMRDYLLFIAELAHAQHEVLQRYPTGRAARRRRAATRAAQGAACRRSPAVGWPRDPRVARELRRLLGALARAPARRPGARHASTRARRPPTTPGSSSRPIACSRGVMLGLDLGRRAADRRRPAGLLDAARDRDGRGRDGDALAPFGRTDDATRCPCCGSRPTASVTRIGADESGYRYLHCSLCSTQWHMVRIKCSALREHQGHPLPVAASRRDGDERRRSRRARRRGQGRDAATSCGHYLKIVHMETDPNVEPVADDLASVTLDLLVSESRLRSATAST